MGETTMITRGKRSLADVEIDKQTRYNTYHGSETILAGDTGQRTAERTEDCGSTRHSRVSMHPGTAPMLAYLSIIPYKLYAVAGVARPGAEEAFLNAHPVCVVW